MNRCSSAWATRRRGWLLPPTELLAWGHGREFEQAGELAAVGGRSAMADLARISIPERVTKAGCLTDDARRSSVLPQSVPPQKEKRSWSSIRRLLATLPPPPPGPPPPKPELMPVGWPNCGELRLPTNPPGL